MIGRSGTEGASLNLDKGYLYIDAAGDHAIHLKRDIYIACAIDAYSASEETIVSTQRSITRDKDLVTLWTGSETGNYCYSGEYVAEKNAYYCELIYKELTGDYKLECSSDSPTVGDTITLTATNAPDDIIITWQRTEYGINSPWVDLERPENDILQ